MADEEVVHLRKIVISHRSHPIHLAPVRIDQVDPNSVRDLHLLQATPHPEAGTGQFEGPCSLTTKGGGDLQNRLQCLPQGVHRSDRQNFGSLAKGTQTGSNKW